MVLKVDLMDKQQALHDEQCSHCQYCYTRVGTSLSQCGCLTRWVKRLILGSAHALVKVKANLLRVSGLGTRAECQNISPAAVMSSVFAFRMEQNCIDELAAGVKLAGNCCANDFIAVSESTQSQEA